MEDSRPSTLSRIDRVLAPVTWVAAALVVLLLFVGPSLVGADKPAAAAPAGAKAAAPASGAAVFASAGCGGCHTFKAAGSSGAVGPNLDNVGLDATAVQAVVTSGRGAMPRFGGQLSAAEISAVANYVASGGKEAVATATATPTATPAAAGRRSQPPSAPVTALTGSRSRPTARCGSPTPRRARSCRSPPAPAR